MIRGQGMPSFRHHHCGNMFIQFDVKFPEKGFTENEEFFEQLRKILPSTPPKVAPPAETMTENADLEDVDPNQQARATDEEDEDGHPGGAERVQCASQ